jgi:hypothetical protein
MIRAFALLLCGCSVVDSDAVASGKDVGHEIADQIDDEFVEHNPHVLAAQTGSILHALDAGEIAQADAALQMLARKDAQNLAYGFVIAYLQANVQLDGVMHAYDADFISTQAEAMLVTEATAGVELLTSTPPAQMDRVFLELQVRMQSTAQVMLDELERKNASEPIDAYLKGYRDMTDDHLDRANRILDDLD